MPQASPKSPGWIDTDGKGHKTIGAVWGVCQEGARRAQLHCDLMSQTPALGTTEEHAAGCHLPTVPLALRLYLWKLGITWLRQTKTQRSRRAQWREVGRPTQCLGGGELTGQCSQLRVQ